MNLKKKLSVLTALAVFQAFAAIPANALAADQSDTTTVNTANVKSVEVVKKEQTIAESDVKSGSDSKQSDNNEVEGTNPVTNEPTGTDVTPVDPVIDPADEEDAGEETTVPTAPVEVEQPSTSGQSVAGSKGGDLTLYMNSNKMVQDGKTYLAGQPMAVKNGVSYVAIRALVDRVGYEVKYDNTTKETIIISGEDELRFKTNSSVYTVNGESRTMKGPAYQQKIRSWCH